MAVEDLKRWHWILIGGLVGVALAYMWVGGGVDVDRIRNVGEREFERDLLMIDDKSQLPYIKDIVVHPPQQTFEGTVNVVTYKRLARDKQGRTGWLDARVMAKIPYKPAISGRVKDDPGMTIRQYLQALADDHSQVRFSYGWWLEPRSAMALGALGGAAAIGGIWPTLLNLMIGAGFGRKRDHEPAAAERKKESWFAQFRSRKSSVDPDTRPKLQPTAADRDKVQAVADEYERNLQGVIATAPATVAQVSDQGAPNVVRKLDGGPVEAAAPMKRPEDEDEIEVKGEFYPVLIHHQKKKDQPDSSH